MLRNLILIITISVFFVGCNKKVKQPLSAKAKQYNSIKHNAWFGTYKNFVKVSKNYNFKTGTYIYNTDELLKYASYSKFKPCDKINFMIKKGLDLKNIDNMFYDAAYGFGHTKGLECLVKLGANPLKLRSDKNNALHRFAKGYLHNKDDIKRKRMLEYLLSLKINTNQKNINGKTPRDIAIKMNDYLTYTFLKNYNPDKKLKDYLEKNKIQILAEYYVNKSFGIDKPTYPYAPYKPSLPKIKKLKKGEFETTKEYNKRVKKTQYKRDIEIQNIHEKYNRSVAKYNKKVKNISDTYNNKLSYIEKNTEKIKALGLKKAYMHHYGTPIIKDIKYVADEQKFYAKLVSSKGDINYSIRFYFPLKYAKKAKNEILNSVPKVKFQYKDDTIIIKNIIVKYKKIDYSVQVINKELKKQNIIIKVMNKISSVHPIFLKPKIIKTIDKVKYSKKSIKNNKKHTPSAKKKKKAIKYKKKVIPHKVNQKITKSKHMVKKKVKVKTNTLMSKSKSDYEKEMLEFENTIMSDIEKLEAEIKEIN